MEILSPIGAMYCLHSVDPPQPPHPPFFFFIIMVPQGRDHEWELLKTVGRVEERKLLNHCFLIIIRPETQKCLSSRKQLNFLVHVRATYWVLGSLFVSAVFVRGEALKQHVTVIDQEVPFILLHQNTGFNIGATQKNRLYLLASELHDHFGCSSF